MRKEWRENDTGIKMLAGLSCHEEDRLEKLDEKYKSRCIKRLEEWNAPLLLFAKLFDGSFFNLIDAEYLNLQGCRQIS